MTSKEFLKIASETLHHGTKVTYESILLDLSMYALYERNYYKEKYGNCAVAEHYDEAFRKIVEFLKEKKYY